MAQLVLSRWRLFYREPSALFWSYGFPLLMTIALGIAFRNRPPEPVELALATSEADDAADRAAAEGALRASALVKLQRLARPEAERALYTGKVALLLFPRQAGGEPRRYLYNQTRPEARLARLFVDDVLQRAAGRADVVRAADTYVTAPGARYIDFLVPGLVGFGLMSSGLWGVGYVIAEMRARRLLKRMSATPMRRSQFLLSFVIMRGLFLVGELPLLLGFAWLFFSVPVRGSLLLLGGIALLGAFVFAGLGLLCASRASNVQTVGGLINLVTLPMMMCSGVFFSASRFPEVLQPLIRALPLTAVNDAMRAIMLEGAGLTQILAPLAVLAVWGAASFGLALWWFRWR